jgi:hypothetical protein
MKKYDVCGKCGGNGNLDACGYCKQQEDPLRMDPAKGGIDICGNCLRFSDSRFNNSGCVVCDGTPFSGKVYDQCGVCGGKGDCKPVSIGGWTIGGIVLGSVGVVGAGVFICMKRRETRMKSDIDQLLRQYLPLDAAESLNSPGQKVKPKTGDKQRLVHSAQDDSTGDEPTTV